MFRLGGDLQVYLHREPIDFRAGINSLAVLVQQTMSLDPFAPAVFAFCNRRCDRVKLLFFDRSGFVLVLKRLTEDKLPATPLCLSVMRTPDVFATDHDGLRRVF